MHEANFGMKKDQINEWFCTIYPVEFDQETETSHTNSDEPTRLFKYKNGRVIFDDWWCFNDGNYNLVNFCSRYTFF